MDGGAERKPVPFLRSEFNELFRPALSGQPLDGLHVGRIGEERGLCAPISSRRRPMENFDRGRRAAALARDGKELFFVGAYGKMIAVAAKAGAGASPSFEPGPPQPLFEAHVDQSPVNDLFEYDVTTDGKHFLLNTVVGSASAPVLTVASNWAAGLKK